MILASRDSASSLPESIGIDAIGPFRDTASSGQDRSASSAAAFDLGQLLLYGFYQHAPSSVRLLIKKNRREYIHSSSPSTWLARTSKMKGGIISARLEFDSPAFRIEFAKVAFFG